MAKYAGRDAWFSARLILLAAFSSIIISIYVVFIEYREKYIYWLVRRSVIRCGIIFSTDTDSRSDIYSCVASPTAV
jgi:hypothetical protein